MPHPAHFICGNKCRFHLATYVGKYVVSTVGEYWPERGVRKIHAEIYDPKWHAANKHLLGDNYDYEYMKHFGFEEIGCDRKFETMVFEARKEKDKCCPWRIVVQKEADYAAYNSADDATIGHNKLCAKWSKKAVTK